MDTSEFFQRLRTSRGACILNSSVNSRSYEEVMKIVDNNIAVLKKSFPKGHTRVVLLDISLGWRTVPVILAAIHQSITFIPIDQIRNPVQARAIINLFGKETLIAESGLDAEGSLTGSVSSEMDAGMDELIAVAFLLFTSGTTGNPKGVMLTYENIWSNVAGILERFQIGQNDSLMIVRPLTHASAMIGELLAGLAAGCQLHIADLDRGPIGAMKRIPELGITVLCLTPTLAAYYSNFKQRYDFSSVRLIVLSGETLAYSHFRIIAEAFPNADIWNAYGLTEASPRVSYNLTLFDCFEANCVGYPIGGVDLAIMNDKNDLCAEGEIGELHVSGSSIMKGYFLNHSLSSQKVNDGWLRTGDAAYISGGKLYIVDRLDQMVIRGGNNVYPGEIEEVLLGHPQVREAVAFGYVDGKNRMRLKVQVITDLGVDKEALHKFIISQSVDPRIWPDEIEIVTELSRTLSGKRKRPEHNIQNIGEDAGAE